jgi:formate dehydrogenase
VDRTGVAAQSSGFAEVEAAQARYTVSEAATVTGIDDAVIRQLARDFASAEYAAAYGRVGICGYPGATLANFLIDALNGVSGNFDRQGGLIFGQAPIDLAGLAARFGQGGYAKRHVPGRRAAGCRRSHAVGADRRDQHLTTDTASSADHQCR